MDKFECCRCGRCCTNLKHAFSDDSKQKIIFRLAENKDIGLPLWEFEAERLASIAKQRNMNVKIEPLQFFYDTLSEQSIIVSFHMNAESCPFFNETCTIYEQRPATCAMFPLLSSSIFEFDFGRKPTFAKTLCNRNNSESCYEAANKERFEEKMRIYYGNSFEAAVKNDETNMFVAKTMKDLTGKKLILPFVGERAEALKIFLKSRRKTFFKFISEKEIALDV